MITAVVLLSGGIDSATCLASAVDKHGSANVAALSIFYGQRHSAELQAARAVAKFYNVTHYELDASEVFRNSDSALLATSTATLEKSSYAAQISENKSQPISTCVPFRNGLMISMAASFADGLGDEIELYIGVHSDDTSGTAAYADCSAPFVEAMSAAVKIGTYGKIQLVAPFLNQTKAYVVKVGLKLGAPYHLTRSCYERGDKPCGKCATCIDRARAFELNGVKDPAIN